MKNLNVMNELREKNNIKEEIYEHEAFVELTNDGEKPPDNFKTWSRSKAMLLRFVFLDKARHLMVCGGSIPSSQQF